MQNQKKSFVFKIVKNTIKHHKINSPNPPKYMDYEYITCEIHHQFYVTDDLKVIPYRKNNYTISFPKSSPIWLDLQDNPDENIGVVGTILEIPINPYRANIPQHPCIYNNALDEIEMFQLEREFCGLPGLKNEEIILNSICVFIHEDENQDVIVSKLINWIDINGGFINPINN